MPRPIPQPARSGPACRAARLSWRNSLASRSDAEQFAGRTPLQRKREGRPAELSGAIEQLDERGGLLGLAGDGHRVARELQGVKPGWRRQHLRQLFEGLHVFLGVATEIVERLSTIARERNLALQISGTPGLRVQFSDF